jgi:hypothetical protein
MDRNTVAELAAGIARIEQRQAAYETVAHRILGCLEVHNEKIDLILKEMLREPGPSPTTTVLTEILGTMKHQAELLEGLSEPEWTPDFDEDGPDDALDKKVAR